MVTLFMINPLNSIGFRKRYKKLGHILTASHYVVIEQLFKNRKEKKR